MELGSGEPKEIMDLVSGKPMETIALGSGKLHDYPSVRRLLLYLWQQGFDTAYDRPNQAFCWKKKEFRRSFDDCRGR